MDKTGRPSKDEYYLIIAKDVALRATCLRRRYGAVIVKNDAQVSAGYCGAPRECPNCIDLGSCYREQNNIPSGERYDLCRSEHAEVNALLNAARQGTSVLNGVIYLAGIDKDGKEFPAAPCKKCRKAIINVGLEAIVMREADGKIHKELIKDWVKAANLNPDLLVEVPKKEHAQK